MISSFRTMRRQANTPDSGRRFPTKQLFVLALCRICEPIAFMSIFPYVYYMVDYFHVTDDDRKISLWAGAVTSSFTLAEFSTGVFWGRMSDSFGRKPVLLMGLVGTAISMTVFGFSNSLPMALVARALGGFLNGNIGVLQTTVAELVTDKKHQARAYSIMPSVWCLGSIIGPAMGGALAQPADNYPSLFPRGTIFARHPFLLPNLVCVIVLLCGITVGILFLEETHVDKRMRRDRGLELGKWLTAKVSRIMAPMISQKNKDSGDIDDMTPFIVDEDPPPGYRSIESSPRLTSVPEPINSKDETRMKAKRSVRRAFTPNVVFIIVGYGVLAYHSVSFDQLMPIFLSTPVSDSELTPPFKFVGGLGLSSKTIGLMFAVQGGYALFAQLWLFPLIVNRVGTLSSYCLTQLVWPLLYVAVPYLVLLPTCLQIPATYVSLLLKMTFHVISFPSNAMLLANAAPSHTVLGSINGVAASIASLSRALGPTVTGYLYSNGLQSGYVGLAWWVCGIVCALGAAESFWIRDEEHKKTNDCNEKAAIADDDDDDDDDEEDDNGDCEADADSSYLTHYMVSANASQEHRLQLSSASPSPSPSFPWQFAENRQPHGTPPQEAMEVIPDLELRAYVDDNRSCVAGYRTA